MVDRELEQALAGHTRTLFVEGESGIGKTRLMLEAGARAALQNFRVLKGGCTEAEGMLPYLPFLEALGGYIRQAEPALLRSHVGLNQAIIGQRPEL